jgi:ankyrin repeat protein
MRSFLKPALLSVLLCGWLAPGLWASSATPDPALAFLDTVSFGTTAQVDAAIKAGADVNQRLADSWPEALFNKTRFAHMSGIWSARGATPLMMALAFNHDLNVAKLLVQKGADIHARDGDDGDGDSSILVYAALGGNAAAVTYVLSLGLGIDEGSQGATAVYYAAWLGTVSTVQTLVTAGAHFPRDGQKKTTILMWASWNITGAGPDILRYLLKLGRDATATVDDWTALDHACCYGTLANAQVLEGAGLKFGFEELWASVQNTTGSGPDLIKYSVAQGAPLKNRTENGKSALEEACSGGTLANVEALVALGMDPLELRQPGKDDLGGQSTLMFAATNTQGYGPDIIRYLVKAGVSLKQEDHNYGTTALLDACAEGTLEDLQTLLSLGMTVDDVGSGVDSNGNSDPETALMAAARNTGDGSVDIIAFLLQQPVKLEAVRSGRYTALLNACRWGTAANVKALVEAKADLSAKTAKGDTCLTLAAKNEDNGKEITEYLQSVGAK